MTTTLTWTRWAVAAAWVAAAPAMAAAYMLGDFETADQVAPGPSLAASGQWAGCQARLGRTRCGATRGAFAARVVFAKASTRQAGLACCPVMRDWRPFDALALDAVWRYGQPITLRLRIDAGGKQAWLGSTLQPRVATSVRFDLSSASKQIDMGRVTGLLLCLDQTPGPCELLIDNVRLENGGGELAQPQPIAIKRTATRPRIDGRTLDDAWSKAEWRSDFWRFNLPRQPAQPKTSFAMVHDGQTLFVAVRADEPQTQALRAEVKARDGKVWTDDSIEVFLDTEGQGQRYHHFIINSRGALYDAEVSERGLSRDPGWQSSARCAAQVAKGTGWSVELAIPLAELWLRPGATDAWRVNVARRRRVGAAPELFTCARLCGTLHRPQAFVPAQVADASFDCFLWDIARPQNVRLVPRGEEMTLSAQLDMRNRASSLRRTAAGITLHVRGAESIADLPACRFAQGALRSFTLSMPAPGVGCGRLDVMLREQDPARVVCHRQFPVELKYEPLRVALVRPGYRNCLFAGQQLDAVELDVATGLSPSEWGEYRFDCQLSRERRVEARAAARIAGRHTRLRMALPGLGTGAHNLRGRLVHDSGKISAEWQGALRKLPRQPGEVRLDAGGALRVDGARFVPFGTWGCSSAAALGQARQWGFTVVQDSGNVWRSDAEQRAYLDAAQAAGLKVLCWPFPLKLSSYKADWTGPLRGGDGDDVRAYVRKWKTHPAILAWYMADEPESAPASLERLRAVYEIVSDEDPYHPCVIVNNTVDGIRRYIGCADVSSPDPYPGYLAGGGVAGLADLTTRFVRTAAAGRRAVWVTLQAHNLGDYRQAGQRPPGLADLRHQLYQAVIAGAKGFTWFCHAAAANYPQVGLGLEYLAREVRALQPAILAPDSAASFAVEPNAGAWLAARRDVGADVFLFVVSLQREPATAMCRGDGLADGRLHVVGERRTVEVEGSAFRDHFAAYGVHVYTSRAKLAKGLDMAPTIAHIASARRALAKPGNLAHLSRGATVRVSSMGKFARAPERIIDGAHALTWYDNTPQQLPDWIEITLPKPEPVAKIVVDSNIVKFRVECEADGRWVTVAEPAFGPLAAQAERAVRVIEFAPTRTRRLRVSSLAVSGRWSRGRTVVAEVEAYAPVGR